SRDELAEVTSRPVLVDLILSSDRKLVRGRIQVGAIGAVLRPDRRVTKTEGKSVPAICDLDLSAMSFGLGHIAPLKDQARSGKRRLTDKGSDSLALDEILHILREVGRLCLEPIAIHQKVVEGQHRANLKRGTGLGLQVRIWSKIEQR